MKTHLYYIISINFNQNLDSSKQFPVNITIYNTKNILIQKLCNILKMYYIIKKCHKN